MTHPIQAAPADNARGYKVDISRGQRIGRVSSEWFSRPDDERFTRKGIAVLEAGGRFEPFSYEVGELHPDEVEIDVLHCGICHSDLSMVDNEWGMSKYHLVAGHEVIGRISARGSHVLNLEEGTVVGLGWHCGYCGHCHSCKTGDQNLCAEAQSTIVAHHGGHLCRDFP